MKPLVSVVIPTYNSEKTLPLCLESIRKQTYERIEIIGVDKGSRDKTVKIAREYGARVFVIDATERSEQVNYGARKARGKYIYRVDSDFVLQPDVIAKAVKKCESEGYDAVCIHNTSDPSISFWARVRMLERDCYLGDRLNVAARFFRKDVFLKARGFDESLVVAEDYDLHNRLLKMGFRIGYVDAFEVHVGEPKTLREVVLKSFYYGKTIKNFMKKNKAQAIKQLTPIRPAFLRNWRRFLEDPKLTLGFIIYQFIRYTSAGIGTLTSLKAG
ncbi:glycosyl transferase [Candidatus Bathyarchaeota archaeon]|nr:MAG: glycosyl transferase [Candidatus Bathyarchaeota archaeon]